MNIYHRKAIELKYLGYAYEEISKTMGGKISAGVLRNYFALGGKLYTPYLEYEAEQIDFREAETRNEFKKQASHAGKIMRSLLQKSLKGGNDKLAFEILKEQLDRAGMVVVRKSFEKEILREGGVGDPSLLSDDEINKKLEDMGLCRFTGLSLHALKSMGEEGREKMLGKIREYWKSIS